MAIRVRVRVPPWRTQYEVACMAIRVRVRVPPWGTQYEVTFTLMVAFQSHYLQFVAHPGVCMRPGPNTLMLA